MSLAEFGQFFSQFTEEKQSHVNAINEGHLELDKNFFIQNHKGAVLAQLVGDQSLRGASFVSILQQNTTPDVFHSIKPVLKSLITNADIIGSTKTRNPFDCLKLTYKNKEGKLTQRHVRIEFRKQKSFSKTGKWSVVINDISRSVRLSNKVRRMTAMADLKVNTVMSLIEFEQDLIEDFLQSTTISLKSIFKYVAAPNLSHKAVKDSIEHIYCIVHTIKGDAAILNLSSISQEAHRFENLLSVLNDKDKLDRKDIKRMIAPLKNMIQAVKMVKSLFDKISEGGWNTKKTDSNKALLQRLEHLVKKLSVDNRKDIKIINDGYLDSNMPPHLYRVISSLVTQLARNAVVHGIEPREQRLQQRKTPYGCLHITAKPTKNGVEIKMRDDGRGIDAEKIRQTAKKSKRFSHQQIAQWTNASILQAIFIPGFSTQGTVSEHAGRGIGLDVIKHTVEKHKGKITVSSVPGMFTEFTIVLPNVPLLRSVKNAAN